MSDSALPEIPLFDARSGADLWRRQIDAAIAEVVDSGRFILGPNVEAFERQFAAWLGAKHAVAVNSGTDALVIGLRAMGIGPGDEVVTSPFTFVATAEAVRLVGATPVFADIDPNTFNLDPGRVEACITSRTRAILPVHLYGHAAEMEAIGRIAADAGLKVLEDVAQACGGRYGGRLLGTFGDAAAFSFFPSKTLGAFGDGGLLATDDDHLAAEARILRAHGSPRKNHAEQIGYNSRLDEIQAAVLRVKLPYLDQCNEDRRRRAAAYDRHLAGLPGVTLPAVRDGVDHAYHQYTVRIDGNRRDSVGRGLAAAGIQTGIYYPLPIPRMPAYADTGADCPEADAVSRQVLSLPIWPTMEGAVQERVIRAFRRLVTGRGN